MIISASRRTDIPSYYSEWFFNRLREGYVLVRNPMNVHRVSMVTLSPDVVDGIVIWTKNPISLLEKLNELDRYNYYFQFTLNSYGVDVEPNVPSKSQIIIPAFQRLSEMIGRERVIWRYDPIFLNDKYTIDYHCKYFQILASKLCGYTEKCIVSFVDLYKKTVRNISPLKIQNISWEQQMKLMECFSKVAANFGITLETCAENADLESFGIAHAHCVDKKMFESMGNCSLSIEKDKNQRGECGCVASIDIGAYNTCLNGCLYCYANFNKEIVKKNALIHNPKSPLLFGELKPDDVVTERKVKSCKECAINLFPNVV